MPACTTYLMAGPLALSKNFGIGAALGPTGGPLPIKVLRVADAS
jgi:hypothetical protein